MTIEIVHYYKCKCNVKEENEENKEEEGDNKTIQKYGKIVRGKEN